MVSSFGFPKASFSSISMRQRLGEAAFISYSIGGGEVMLKNISKYNSEYSLSFTTTSSILLKQGKRKAHANTQRGDFVKCYANNL